MSAVKTKSVGGKEATTILRPLSVDAIVDVMLSMNPAGPLRVGGVQLCGRNLTIAVALEPKTSSQHGRLVDWSRRSHPKSASALVNASAAGEPDTPSREFCPRRLASGAHLDPGLVSGMRLSAQSRTDCEQRAMDDGSMARGLVGSWARGFCCCLHFTVEDF